ncbi:AAA family ATPase, partial [Chlorobium phaeovibrioides]|nr:AAA family ATPase [Chlorobium phaeovibrioides]
MKQPRLKRRPSMSELPMLTIHPAGAGSGKTYKIQKTLGEWVKEGKVAPEKIVAVTYTETAAAELVGRIREELVQEGMLDEAFRLESAYISTIHGFGRRILQEFAFDAGISPTLRKISKDEETMLAGKVLAGSPSAVGLMETLEEDGYGFNFGTKATAEDGFRKRLLNITDQLRSLSGATSPEWLEERTGKKIADVYGGIEDAETLKAALLRAVENTLEAFPLDISNTYDLKAGPKKKVWNNYRLLKRASRSTTLDTDWKLWHKLSQLHFYKKDEPLPKDYNDHIVKVIATAERLVYHPGPLADAQEHAARLLRAAGETLAGYEKEKGKRGLLDFMDMLSISYRLFKEHPEVLALFRRRMECLVVDEFQDTSPLQFSLVWSLRKTEPTVPAIVVGDVKQAIMGFQNADERLLAEMSNKYPTSPLEGNWRSSPELMRWINQVGGAMFHEGYTALEAKAKFRSSMEPLEIIAAAEPLKEAAWASYTVNRIQELIATKQQVWDKKLNVPRDIRGGDIAIICYKNKRLTFYAEALRKAGIRCRLEEEGWLDSRIVQLAWHCLAYVADPGDRHAALYLASTELGTGSLQSALTGLMEGGAVGDRILEKLEGVAERPKDRTVDAILDDIVTTLDLYGTIAGWPDGAEARADLLKLQDECIQFMTSSREALSSGGYYGSGIKTFLAWLKAKMEATDSAGRENNTRPSPSIIDEEAVQLMTWHKSKGGEWPVVAVCGMDDGEFPRLPNTKVDYDDFSDLDTIMDHAWVRIHPKFHSKEKNDAFVEDLKPESHENSKRLLYVALTRAREKVILEWPEYLPKTKGKWQGTYWAEFCRAAKAEVTPTGMSIEGMEFSCPVSTITVKTGIEIEAASTESSLPVFGRRAIRRSTMPETLTPEAVRPSSLHNDSGAAGTPREDIQYGNGFSIDIPGVDDPMEKGKILHRAFELLSGHPEREELLRESFEGMLANEQLKPVNDAVRAFDAWLGSRFSIIKRHAELPLLALHTDGSVVAGFTDLVVETDDGLWIVDHKSDQVTTEALLEERFTIYLPQLRCYADALAAARPDKPVKGLMLNWVSFG